MKQKKYKMYLYVSTDKYSRILEWADSTAELAKKIGVKKSTIDSEMSRFMHHTYGDRPMRYEKVEFMADPAEMEQKDD